MDEFEDDELSDEEREQLLKAIDEGLADAQAGRVKPLSEVIERLRRRQREMTPEIKAAWDEEVQRRKTQLESGETSTRPWDEVKADLEKL